MKQKFLSLMLAMTLTITGLSLISVDSAYAATTTTSPSSGENEEDTSSSYESDSDDEEEEFDEGDDEDYDWDDEDDDDEDTPASVGKIKVNYDAMGGGTSKENAVTVIKGKTTTLKFINLPSGARVTYKMSNYNISISKSFKVKGLKNGTTCVKVYVNKKYIGKVYFLITTSKISSTLSGNGKKFTFDPNYTASNPKKTGITLYAYYKESEPNKIVNSNNIKLVLSGDTKGFKITDYDKNLIKVTKGGGKTKSYVFSAAGVPMNEEGWITTKVAWRMTLDNGGQKTEQKMYLLFKIKAKKLY